MQSKNMYVGASLHTICSTNMVGHCGYCCLLSWLLVAIFLMLTVYFCFIRRIIGSLFNNRQAEYFLFYKFAVYKIQHIQCTTYRTMILS
jgi:hypothetical protein